MLTVKLCASINPLVRSSRSRRSGGKSSHISQRHYISVLGCYQDVPVRVAELCFENHQCGTRNELDMKNDFQGKTNRKTFRTTFLNYLTNAMRHPVSSSLSWPMRTKNPAGYMIVKNF